MAQKCFRQKGDNNCPLHPGQKVTLQCKDCPPGSLVCRLCITTLHNGHQFCQINEGITDKLDRIKQFVQTTETMTLPQITEKIKSVIQKKKKTTESYREEIEALERQAKHLKYLVDHNLAIGVFKLESDMGESMNCLDGHQTDLKKIKSQLVDEMKESKETYNSQCDDILVVDTEIAIVKKGAIYIPPTPDIFVPHFMPYEVPEPLVEKAFGEIEGKAVKPKGLVHASSATADTGFNKYSTSPVDKRLTTPESIVGRGKTTSSSQRTDVRGNSKQQSPSMVILDKAVQFSKFNTCQTWSICPVFNNKAWVCGRDTTKVELTNDKGVVQCTLTLDVKVKKICLHPQNGEMYGVCPDDKSIRHINTQSSRTTVMFNTDQKPLAIACTSDKVIVGTDSDRYTSVRVCMYTYQGQLVHTYDIGNQYTCINHISVCSLTNRVAVTCGTVVVLDSTLHEIHTYRGEAIGRMMRQFPMRLYPHEAVFDDTGNILVGNSHDHEVHILNGSTYTTMCTLHTEGMSDVFSLGTHQGVLWVGGMDEDENNKIVCLRYMK